MIKKDSFLIQGGAGQRILNGTIKVDNSKNTALSALCASIIFDTPVQYENISIYSDIETLLETLEDIGVKCSKSEANIVLDPSGDIKNKLNPTFLSKIRGSIQLTGPLLARTKSVSFCNPGGCDIGDRSIDFFTSLYESMGAVRSSDNKTNIKYIAHNSLKGVEFSFPKSSVTGTITAVFTAVLAKGNTTLKNCAIEPDVISILSFLKECGAEISGIGTRTLSIKGRDGRLLSAKGKIFKNTQDRIQAGEYLIFAACLAKKVIIENFPVKDCKSVIDFIKNTSNLDIHIEDRSIEISTQLDSVDAPLGEAAQIETKEYPGFPTDLQTIIAVYLSMLKGESIIIENIFENRIEQQLINLRKMGVNLELFNSHKAKIKGPSKLKSYDLSSTDLRSGVAYVLTALLAEGESRITDIDKIDRGHYKIEQDLSNLGAFVKRE